MEASDPRLGPKLIEPAAQVERERIRIVAEYRTAMGSMTRRTEQFVRELRRKYDAALQTPRRPDVSMRARLGYALDRAAGKLRPRSHVYRGEKNPQ